MGELCFNWVFLVDFIIDIYKTLITKIYMNFTLSINEEQLKLIRAEAERLSIPVSSYFKIKALENLKSEVSQIN